MCGRDGESVRLGEREWGEGDRERGWESERE